MCRLTFLLLLASLTATFAYPSVDLRAAEPDWTVLKVKVPQLFTIYGEMLQGVIAEVETENADTAKSMEAKLAPHLLTLSSLQDKTVKKIADKELTYRDFEVILEKIAAVGVTFLAESEPELAKISRKTLESILIVIAEYGGKFGVISYGIHTAFYPKKRAPNYNAHEAVGNLIRNHF